MRQRRTIGVFGAQRQRARRWRLPGRVASLAFGLVVVALAGLAVALARGPIDLSDGVSALEDRANAALGDAAGQLRVEIGGMHLGLGPRNAPAPGIYLDSLRLLDADGVPVAEAPSVRIGFRPFDLLAGRLRLSRITVLGASLALRQPTEGAIVGDLAPLDPDGEGAVPLARLLAGLAAAPPPLLASLTQVTFEDTAVMLDLADPAMTLPLREVTVRFLVRDGTLSATAVVPLAEGLPPVTLAAALARDGTVTLTGTVPPTPPDRWPWLSLPANTANLPVSAEFALSLDPDGQIDTAAARLAARPGVVTVAETAVAVTHARLHLRLDSGGLAVETLAVDAGPVAFTAQGRIEADVGEAGNKGATAVLALGPTSLPLDPSAPRGPVARFESGFAALRVRRDPWRIEVADASLSRGDLSVGVTGTVAEGVDGWHLSLGGAVRGLAVPDLLALWPRPVAPGALRWMRARLEAGHVDEAFFSVGGRLDAPRAVLDFAFRDASATPVPPLPPITDASGWGRVDNDAFTLSLAEGHVTMPGLPDGRIDLRGSTFHLAPLSDRDAPGAITVRGEGPVAAVLALIGAPPLSLLDRIDIDPGAASGQARVEADLLVPLRRDLRLAEVGVAVSATVTDAALDLGPPVGTFSAPELRLVADTARLRLDGTGQIGQSSVTVGWDEVFAPASDTPKTTLALSLGIDAADLAALGVDAEALGPAVTVRYGAPLSAEVRVRRDGGGIPPGATAFETTIDLRSTAFSAPVLGVSKPRRAAATLRVDGVADTTGIELDRLQLDAADLRLRARARLDAARRLERLDIDSLRVGADTDLSASVVRVRAGFDATLRGRSLDASGLLAGGTGSAASGGPPIELRLLLDRLVLSPSLAVTEARGNLNRREDGSLAVVVNGSGPGAAALSVTLDRTAAGAGTLRASSSDAGALARGAGLFSRALGGQLDLSATLHRDGAIDGEAQVRDVILSDDPRLDSLLAGADLDEALARLRSEGIRFDTMRLPFRWDGGVITLRDAVAYGPVIGLTLSGSYTTATDDLAMDGVFTPLYGLNSLIGNLPLLGPLLTGGEGQGLLAFTFGLSGPAANPVVSVNPFSVLLPGVLRQILQPGPDSGPATPPD